MTILKAPLTSPHNAHIHHSFKRAQVPKGSLTTKWREVQGSNNWDKLLTPLNPLLQSELVRYGDLVSACYEALDLSPSSKRYLRCKYGKKSFFSSTKTNTKYQVTKYIYATPDISIPTQVGSSASRWIGYVAVCSDEEVSRLGRRDIVVSFRGTVANTEWIANMMSALTPARFDAADPRPDVKVESGFLSLYCSYDSGCSKFSHGSCREQLLKEIARLVRKHGGEEVSVTLAGHSMGSSLAVLLGYDLAELGLAARGRVQVTVFSYGGPRVGNLGFRRRCEELGVKVLRVVNVNDPVTMVPGVILNGRWWRVLGGDCYAHVGVELALEFFRMDRPSCVHDLGSYIELIRGKEEDMGAGRRRSGGDFLGMIGDFVKGRKADAWRWQRAAGGQVGNLVQLIGF